MSPTTELHRLGQRLWLDNIRRRQRTVLRLCAALLCGAVRQRTTRGCCERFYPVG